MFGSAGEDYDRSSAPPNYCREAFLLEYNWIGLLAAAAFSLVVLSPFPLLAAAGLELMYLSVVPSSPRFQRWVQSRLQVFDWRQKQMELARLLKELPPQLRKRYLALERMCLSIRSNHNQLSSTSRVLLEQIDSNLAGLLGSYLRFLAATHQHQVHVSESGWKAIAQEIEKLEKSPHPATAGIAEINRKRLEILKERRARMQKILENTKILNAQCTAIEDMIKLMHDQSMTLRDPSQITDRLGFLLEDAQRTEKTVQDVESWNDAAYIGD